MLKKTLFTVALTAQVFAQDEETQIPQCLDGTDATLKDINTVEYPVSWEITLNPGKKCSYVTYSEAYLRWS